MEKVIAETPPRLNSPGRLWLGLGLAVSLVGVLAYGLQLGLKQLVVPWYLPVLGTVGVLMVLAAYWRRLTVTRFLSLGFLTLLCAGEWYFLVVMSRLPDYTGPAKVGQVLPSFTTQRADGQPFTDKDLQQGTPTVLLFFRGRW
jgi:hypothetical protein